MESLLQDARQIARSAIAAVVPDHAVRAALADWTPPLGRTYVVAIGKAAWPMAQAASEVLRPQDRGIVLTKYHHSKGEIPHFSIFEGGHPVPDQASVEGTLQILSLIETVTADDVVLFLVSGGGSALFEAPLPEISLAQIQTLTSQLLRSGATIHEINTLRKRLSRVKGGRFAQLCAPAQVKALVLSDVVGDSLDVIASGPAYPDQSTVADTQRIVSHYQIPLEDAVATALQKETPKALPNVETEIIGSVSLLCDAAAQAARALGYHPYLLTTRMEGDARQQGELLGTIARQLEENPNSGFQKPCALLLGGETTVVVRGDGLGGRNQELALAAAQQMQGLSRCVLLSIGSDGTDGPTDAAGGLVDGTTCARLQAQGLTALQFLDNNDSYHGLDAAGALLKTGATGTNVNDLVLLLCR